MTKMKHINMTLAEWSEIPDNPIQRNTEGHANRASRPNGHLSKMHPTHRAVAMAETAKGKRWKLDGHSRSFLWDQEMLAPPPTDLEVTVYPVKDEAEAIAFYRTFDNSAATETKRDKLFGALRLHGIIPKHGYMFANCGVVSAVEYTVFPLNWTDVRNLPFDEMIQPWVRTIEIIDSGEFTNHTIFRSTFMLAMLLTVRRDGNEALSFWQGFHDDVGKKSAKTVDGIFMARDVLEIMHKEAAHRGGRRGHGIYAPYILYAYDCWHNSQRIPRMDRIIDGKKLPKNVSTVREWWDHNIGELDHPQIRKPEKVKPVAKQSTKASRKIEEKAQNAKKQLDLLR